MTTTRAPQTAEEHTAEARRLLTLTRPEGLTPTEFNEYLTFDNSTAIVAAANVHATLALVEEQRTANLVAAYNGDLLKNPHPVGSHEHDVWWSKTAGDLTERVGVQR
ncbi:hypothetical protein KK103_11790 [Curtobacterium flaccumfaciens pv. flaccumfaciens]|uniref:Uncharacterized protein n=1 Tax=Curtobacterium flaccumfaciens pv. flaccumfaciens TaxID=138532 RepID=A0A9Q2W6H8_9MICO|nr:hypothetical protein [Curtobacterium flaccumfaciens]MBT1542446.1 hypothetical protein [Curtobacterium flaccumfaciens pv. flaccumfaciens]